MTGVVDASPVRARRFLGAVSWRAMAPWLWLAPTLALLVPFFLIPLAIVVRYSFNIDDPLALMVSGFTFDNYVKILTDGYYFELFVNTISVSFLVAVCCLLIGYPFAYFLVRYSRRSRGFLIWAIYTPLIVSVIVRVFGWIVVTSDSGLINSLLIAVGAITEPLRIMFEVEGMTLGMVHRYLPMMALPLINAIAKVDHDLVKAADGLGAGPVRNFFTVTLPLSLPGIVAGTQLVFANALSDFVLPNLMGTTRFRMLAPAIYEESSQNLAWALAATLSTSMLLIVVVILVATTLFYRRIAPWARTL